MNREVKTIFFNMCMIHDQEKNMVVLNRVDKEWSGITFPGGHVEIGESFTDSVIREVFEETGLRIQHPKLCGIKDWIERDCRYVVFLYQTHEFYGELVSSSEGEVFWMKEEEILNSNFAEGFDCMLKVFQEENLSEYFLYKEKEMLL